MQARYMERKLLGKHWETFSVKPRILYIIIVLQHVLNDHL